MEERKHLSCIEYQRFLGAFTLSNQHLNVLLPLPECCLPPKTPLHCVCPLPGASGCSSSSIAVCVESRQV